MHHPQLVTEQFYAFSRLYGAVEWTSYQTGTIQDGSVFNATVDVGPTGTQGSAIKLSSAAKSHMVFDIGTSTIDYSKKDFYFMMYVYLQSGSSGPILQYKNNETHYGFNIWSNGNGSLVIDMVDKSGESNINTQVTVPDTCTNIDDWNFLVVSYWYGNGGKLYITQGLGQDPCVSVTLGQVELEMSHGFFIGRKQRPEANGGDIFLDTKIACLASGTATSSTVNQFHISEQAAWCRQALLETTMDKSIAKRKKMVFHDEEYLIGMWPLNDFHHGKESVGRMFSGKISNISAFGFGPDRQINGSLIFDGATTFASLNDEPNKMQLSASFGLIDNSFTISVFVKGSGPVASFGGPLNDYVS